MPAMPKPRLVILATLISIFAFAAMTTGARADQVSSAGNVQCKTLVDTDLPDTVILSAVEVPGNALVSAYCRVRGYVRPAINFELQLPAKDWNGKFYMAGCGGYCGRMDVPSDPNAAFNVGARRHYATILTDTGHWGSNTQDNRWAAANPVAMNDFFFRNIPEIGRVGKALTRAYYNKEIRYSYFNGCSGGGKQGVVAATLYPDEFDGILAGAPSLDPAGLFASYSWVVAADLAQNKRVFDPKKLPVLEMAVAKACGDPTGLVTDPFNCKFDPKSIQCSSGQESSSCLTEAEVAVVRKWYSPPMLKNGTRPLPGGVAYGSELFWAIPDPNNLFAFERQAAAGFRRFGRIDGPSDDAVDLDRDYPDIELRNRDLRASTDLTKFHAHEGKLILYQGLSDIVVPPAGVAKYYETVQQNLGRASAADTLRLFMVPGLGHCRNPPGSASPGFNDGEFDAFSALEAWVERGTAPQQIVATKHDTQGKADRSLPLCPFPAIAQYKGSGDRASASSYGCVEPKE
jgi:hypothetical protein